MTYFLPEKPDPSILRPVDPGVAPPSFLEGTGAAASRAMLENDSNFRYAREREDVRDGLRATAIEILGPENVWAGLVAQGLAPDVPYDDRAANLMETNLLWKPVIEQMAIDAAEADPKAWANTDLRPEAVEEAVNARLKAEHDELTALIDAMPEKRGLAQFIGGMAGVTADIKNLPFLLIGGGSGSFLKVMGREALINTTAEAAFLPSQYKMADRLDIPDPNVPLQLSTAALGGAAFGAFFEGVGRFARYAERRNAPIEFPGLPAHERLRLGDELEDILRKNEPDAAVKVEQAVFRAYERVGMTDRPFSAVSSRDLDLVPDSPRELEWVPDDLPEDPEVAFEKFIEATEKAILESDAGMKHKYPLGDIVKQRGGIKYKRRNPITGDMELTWAAAELGAMGVTPRTHPWLWRKNGLDHVDNLVASEFERLSEVIPVVEGTGYFDPDAFIQALGDELSGAGKTPLNADIKSMMDEIARAKPDDFRPRERAPAPERVEDGELAYARADAAEAFSDPLSPEASVYHDQIETDLRDWLDNDPGAGLTQAQREFGELLLAEVGIYRDFSEALDLCGRMT